MVEFQAMAIIFFPVEAVQAIGADFPEIVGDGELFADGDSVLEQELEPQFRVAVAADERGRLKQNILVVDGQTDNLHLVVAELRFPVYFRPLLVIK